MHHAPPISFLCICGGVQSKGDDNREVIGEEVALVILIAYNLVAVNLGPIGNKKEVNAEPRIIFGKVFSPVVEGDAIIRGVAIAWESCILAEMVLYTEESLLALKSPHTTV
jgi:hypothetical protein